MFYNVISLLGAPCCMYVTASNSDLLDSFELSIA